MVTSIQIGCCIVSDSDHSDAHSCALRLLVQGWYDEVMTGATTTGNNYCQHNQQPICAFIKNTYFYSKPTCIVLPRPMSSPSIPPIPFVCKLHNHLIPSRWCGYNMVATFALRLKRCFPSTSTKSSSGLGQSPPFAAAGSCGSDWAISDTLAAQTLSVKST